MKKLNQKKLRKVAWLAFAMLSCLFVFVACDFLFPDDKDEAEVYQPKTISGTIVLPTGSTLDVSKCNIQSIYGDASITTNSFSLKVESATVQQMIYFSNQKKDILMAAFINSNQSTLTFNSETTSLALLMLMLQCGGIEESEWDKLANKIKANKYFVDIKSKVEYLIKNETDIFSEKNTDLISLCGNLINDLTGSLKSAEVDKDITPLVITTSGNKVSITNNGKAPLYQITMTKDGVQVNQQTLLASDPVKISIGNILTWKWGVCSPPDPIEFKLDKTGDYEFRASSWDASSLLLSPRFNNAVLVTNQLLCAFGFPLSNECAKKVADFMYSLMVNTVIDMRTMDKDANDAIRVFLDFLLMKAAAIAELTADCCKETNPAKLSEYTEKFIKAAKFGLKCIDVLGKAEASSNAAGLLGQWAYQPTEITFCKHNENNMILTCGTGLFNAVTCNFSTTDLKYFLTYKDNSTTNYFNIGRSFKPESCTITASDFRISGKSPYNNTHTFTTNGLIKNQVITDISFTENIDEYTGSVLEYSTVKKVVLTNLSISLNDISTSGFNEIEYFKNSSGKIVSVSEIYKYWDKKTAKMITARELQSNINSAVFDQSGKIKIGFSTVK